MKAFLLVPAVLIAAGCDSQEQRLETACNDSDAAYLVAQKAISRHLLAPADAKFPKIGQEGVKVERAKEGCKQYVESYVDSANRFGANVRTKFYVFTDRADENTDWAVDMLYFDGDDVKRGAVDPNYMEKRK